MIKRCHAVLLLVAVLTPSPMAAAFIDIADVRVIVQAVATEQGSPPIRVSDNRTGPPSSLTRAEVLIGPADGIRFPNLGAGGFASAAADTNGFFAAGVNQSSFQNSDPANSVNAQGSITQNITNNTAFTVGMDADFSIPAPTLRFFGIGNFPPAGADPSRLGEAQAHIILQTILTHPDGSTDSAEPLIYGLASTRIPLTGVVVAFADQPGDPVTRFDEPDGSFGFRLPDRVEKNFHIADIGPGDSLEFNYIFSTFASTGFGETSAFAAIGDPFDLSLTGGRFKFHLRDATGPVIPEPGTLVMMSFGCVLLAGISVLRLRRRLTAGQTLRSAKRRTLPV
jgi:hypothetical protein